MTDGSAEADSALAVDAAIERRGTEDERALERDQPGDAVTPKRDADAPASQGDSGSDTESDSQGDTETDTGLDASSAVDTAVPDDPDDAAPDSTHDVVDEPVPVPEATADAPAGTPDASESDAVDEPESSSPCVTPPASPGGAAGEPSATRSDVAIRKVLDLGPSFVRIEVDPTTQAVHYMNNGGDIYRLDGDVGVMAYSGLETGATSDVQGMAFGPDGSLYIVANDRSADTFQPVIRVGVPSDGGVRVWSTLATTEPIPESNTAFDHHYNGIVASPDGRFVFVNAGSRTDHGEVQDADGAFPELREVPLTSAIFRIPTNVSGLFLPSDEPALRAGNYLFADGVRNAFDPEFAPNGDLMAGDNGPDADYPEELNVLREGAHYGFPWRLGDVDNPQRSSTYDPDTDRLLTPGFYAVRNGFYHNDPTFPLPPPSTIFVDPIRNLGPDADAYRDPSDGSEKHGSALATGIGTFTPHRVPIGLAFDRGTLCGDFADALFVLSFGADTPTTFSDTGHDLSMIHTTEPGRIQTRQIVRGFRAPIDEVLVGNRLYVLDYDMTASAIWEVTLPRKP